MKKAMVYGNGVSGKGAVKLLKVMGYEVILVDDKDAMDSKTALQNFENVEFFIKSPGIDYNELVLAAKEKGIKIIDEIELTYNYIQENGLKTKIIAVTGTNGKSTTTVKLAELIAYAGYKATYAGNIGVAFSEVILKNKDLDFVVLESSSFQLENLENFKPYISMIINLTPDHIARYKSFDEYYTTKFNITKMQDKSCFFIENIDDPEIIKRENLIKGTIHKISKTAEAQTYAKDGKIYSNNEYIIDADELSLKGSHNLENVLFMIAAAKIIVIPNEKIKTFLMQATPLEHRTELFHKYGKVSFINDSKATNVDSAKVALESYKNCILICGGYDKKVDLRPFAELIKENTKEVYLIGVIGEKIEKLLKEVNYDENKIHRLNELEKTLLFIKDNLDKNTEEVILFSPGTSSYDQFNSFEHRGKVFKEMVLRIFN